MPKTFSAKRRKLLGGLLAMGGHALLARTAFAADGAPVWSYRGDNGPNHWAEIDPANSLCAVGKRQSPIDLNDKTLRGIEPNAEPLSLRWMKTTARLINNGYTIEAELPAGSTLSRSGKVYDLVRLDLHAPSEHLVYGKAYPMEVQFVHKHRETGELAIVSVFLLQGQLNDAFSELSAAFPRRPGKTKEVTDFSPAGLLPPDLAYWAYEGSQTTPPCTENVTWLIVREPMKVDARDIDNFMSIYVGNARPVPVPKKQQDLWPS